MASLAKRSEAAMTADRAWDVRPKQRGEEEEVVVVAMVMKSMDVRQDGCAEGGGCVAPAAMIGNKP